MSDQNHGGVVHPSGAQAAPLTPGWTQGQAQGQAQHQNQFFQSPTLKGGYSSPMSGLAAPIDSAPQIPQVANPVFGQAGTQPQQPNSSYNQFVMPPGATATYTYVPQQNNGMQQGQGYYQQARGLPGNQFNSPTPGYPAHADPNTMYNGSPVPQQNSPQYGDVRGFSPSGQLPTNWSDGRSTPMPGRSPHDAKSESSPMNRPMRTPSNDPGVRTQSHAKNAPLNKSRGGRVQRKRSAHKYISPTVKNMNLLGNHQLVPSPPVDLTRPGCGVGNTSSPLQNIKKNRAPRRIGQAGACGPQSTPRASAPKFSAPGASPLSVTHSASQSQMSGMTNPPGGSPLGAQSAGVGTENTTGETLSPSHSGPPSGDKVFQTNNLGSLDPNAGDVDMSEDIETFDFVGPRRPVNTLIKGDGVDVASPAMISQIIKQCQRGQYINTPSAIFTYHQLELADYLYYIQGCTKMFMINDAQIIEYHKPEMYDPEIDDVRREDRRMAYVLVKDSEGQQTWCRVLGRKKLVPLRAMQQHPTAMFENVLNVKKFILDRLPGIGLPEYARAIAPHDVATAPEGDDVNQALVGNVQGEQNHTSAFAIATPADIDVHSSGYRRPLSPACANMANSASTFTTNDAPEGQPLASECTYESQGQTSTSNIAEPPTQAPFLGNASASSVPGTADESAGPESTPNVATISSTAVTCDESAGLESTPNVAAISSPTVTCAESASPISPDIFAIPESCEWGPFDNSPIYDLDCDLTIDNLEPSAQQTTPPTSPGTFGESPASVSFLDMLGSDLGAWDTTEPNTPHMPPTPADATGMLANQPSTTEDDIGADSAEWYRRLDPLISFTSALNPIDPAFAPTGEPSMNVDEDVMFQYVNLGEEKEVQQDGMANAMMEGLKEKEAIDDTAAKGDPRMTPVVDLPALPENVLDDPFTTSDNASMRPGNLFASHERNYQEGHGQAGLR